MPVCGEYAAGFSPFIPAVAGQIPDTRLLDVAYRGARTGVAVE
jgi:hypothetical protein